jgi:hypothetical protein
MAALAREGVIHRDLAVRGLDGGLGAVARGLAAAASLRQRRVWGASCSRARRGRHPDAAPRCRRRRAADSKRARRLDRPRARQGGRARPLWGPHPAAPPTRALLAWAPSNLARVACGLLSPMQSHTPLPSHRPRTVPAGRRLRAGPRDARPRGPRAAADAARAVDPARGHPQPGAGLGRGEGVGGWSRGSALGTRHAFAPGAASGGLLVCSCRRPLPRAAPARGCPRRARRSGARRATCGRLASRCGRCSPTPPSPTRCWQTRRCAPGAWWRGRGRLGNSSGRARGGPGL